MAIPEGFRLIRRLPLKLRCFIDFMTERLRQKARTRARRAN